MQVVEEASRSKDLFDVVFQVAAIQIDIVLMQSTFNSKLYGHLNEQY